MKAKSKTIELIIAAVWLIAFAIFASIAEGRLGSDIDKAVELYGKPTSQFIKADAPQRIAVWEINGFTIRIEFRDGVADVIEVNSLAWNGSARNNMVRDNLSVLPEYTTRVLPVEKDGSQVVVFFDKATGEALAAYNMKPRPNTENGAAIRMVLNTESAWYKLTFKK